MRSDGEATRARILAAARSEFAQHGLAGARVDRIAQEAKASKERLYAYFGDKRSLFEAVLALNLQETLEQVPGDADDLPGFVGQLFDHVNEHPEHLRMLTWARLEQESDLLPRSPGHRPGPRIPDVARAQAAGLVDPGWDPDDLIRLLFSLATAWANSPEGEFSAAETPETAARARSRRRAAAVTAACRLLELPQP